MTYFPEFEVGHSITVGHHVMSFLRKKFKGVWHTVRIKGYGPSQDQAMRKFLREVYNTALFLKIDPTAVDEGHFGTTEELLYPVDLIQIDETERLKQ